MYMPVITKNNHFVLFMPKINIKHVGACSAPKWHYESQTSRVCYQREVIAVILWQEYKPKDRPSPFMTGYLYKIVLSHSLN
jgi:hypothetical protein